MRKDTSFSFQKLSRDKFSEKYWMNGEAPDQYHSMQIEDGRDELEQLIINDLRALKASTVWNRRRMHELAKRRDEKTAAAIAVATAAMVGLNIASLIISAGYTRRIHQKSRTP